MHCGSRVFIHDYKLSQKDSVKDQISILEESDICSNIRTNDNHDILKNEQNYVSDKEDETTADVVELG